MMPARTVRSLGSASLALAAGAFALAAGTPRPARAVTPADYGTWKATTVNSEILAIHAALMPPKDSSTPAKILFFGGSQHDPRLPFQKNSWRLYNTSTGAVQSIPWTIPEDAFCSGHAHTEDGNLLIVGGNEFYAGNRNFEGEIPSKTPLVVDCPAQGGPMNMHKCEGHFTGAKSTWSFDFASEVFYQGYPMARGRWYPTIVRGESPQFPGQLLALEGHPDVAATQHFNIDIDAFNVLGAPWTNRGTLDTVDLYPRAHLTPYDGIFVSSPTATLDNVSLFQFNNDQYTQEVVLPAPTNPNYWAFHTSSVLLPLRPNASGVYPAGKILLTNDMEPLIVNLDDATPAWNATAARPTPPTGGMPLMRMHANATILATGDVMVTGGVNQPQNDGWDGSEDTSIKYGEVFRDDLQVWHMTTPAQISRNYHSTALLLPDGRIWTAGGNKHAGYAKTGQASGEGRELRIELFEPWYFSRTDRPKIASTPNPPSAGGNWGINTSTSGTAVTRVALIAPGSVTHSFNVDQRYVELKIVSKTSSKVTVSVPANRSLLPKGWYMLVISKSSGGHAAGAHVPSVARWVKLS